MTPKQPINRSVFFARVRDRMGSFNQSQVDGYNAILDRWDSRTDLTDLRWLAYMLATAKHETANTMQPIREYGRGKGRSYGAVDPKTGQAYYGRGFVQLTWNYNYIKMGEILGIPLYQAPDLALDLKNATDIMFEGMTQGLSGKGDFTAYSLENFFNDTKNDPEGARKIINGVDKKDLIADYHHSFLGALV